MFGMLNPVSAVTSKNLINDVDSQSIFIFEFRACFWHDSFKPIGNDMPRTVQYKLRWTLNLGKETSVPPFCYFFIHCFLFINFYSLSLFINFYSLFLFIIIVAFFVFIIVLDIIFFCVGILIIIVVIFIIVIIHFHCFYYCYWYYNPYYHFIIFHNYCYYYHYLLSLSS